MHTHTHTLTDDSINLFLNATQVTAERLVVNITEFVNENNRIIEEIDSLIAGLEDIYARINTVHV